MSEFARVGCVCVCVCACALVLRGVGGGEVLGTRLYYFYVNSTDNKISLKT